MLSRFKSITAREARDIDRRATNNFGISTLILMENAGRHIAQEAIKILHDNKKVAIFCGKGNNGGDGFVAARHLLTKGIRPDLFLTAGVNEIKKEAKINLDILLKLKCKINQVKEKRLSTLEKKISKYPLIIDALLGVGLSGEVRGIIKGLIRIINLSGVRILSVDIPSGLDADKGKALGCCVKADKTVTFLAKKRGMVLGDGLKYCGEIIVKDLGIPL